ncbi:MAG: hypothetical protein COV60_02020, partial [Candidatus Magasanikbacteria bacterium CG11_big_fil_rev_8_21_14_0_20_43_7]
GASTTTLSSLSVNTRYYINIWAYDTFGYNASSTDEILGYTLANAPSDVSGSASGTESITVTWSVNGNPSGTEFYADIDSGTDCGWIADMTQCTFSGLAENTTYTITIQAKNGDGVVSSASAIQVLTQEAETDGGGGGGSPPPPPPKGEEICEPDTEICEPDPENPSGLIIINDGASYTNLSTVTVSFDIAFTDQYALSETENFDGISFAPIVPSVSYTMSDGDGTRTIYARFLNEYGMYIAHDIIELDTVPPDPPAITYFHTGFIEKTNTVSRPPVFRGTAEPGSNILVVVNDISDTNNGSVAMLASFFPQSPFLYIASAGETYTVTTKQDGKWNMQFYQFFEPGEYQVSFTAVDPAGNESPTVDSTPFTITHEDPCLGADPPSYCENLTDVCQTPNPPDSCFGELPPDELPPDELPPDELPPDEPPDDLPPDDFVDGVPGDGLAESDQSLPGSSFVDIKSSETQTSTEQATTHQTATDTIGNIQQVDEDETSRTGFIVAAIGKTIRTIIDNPRVERANERVVAPAVVTLAVANVVVGVGLPHTIAFFRFLFSQPLMVFRRRRKKWGVVYNAYTKQPIELATIRVLEADSGHILRSQVTDMHGRYFMLLDPGHYRVEVDKPGFADSSQILRGKEEDSVYLNLYHAGDTIDFAEDQSVLDVNIPLDPITEDKASALIVKDYVKQSIHKGVSLVGLGISMVSFVISPTLQIAGLVLVHISLYGIFFTLARRRRRDGVGIIRDATNKDTLKHVVVRIFDAAYNKLVDTAVTDRKGYYATLVGPSTYYVTYEKPGYERKRSDTIDLSSKKTRGLGGVIARDEWLHPTVEPVDGEMGVHQRIVHNGTKQVEERVKKVVKADGTIKEDDIDKLKDIAQYGGKNS